MILVGDTHGDTQAFGKLVGKVRNHHPTESIYHLGDVGWGFVKIPKYDKDVHLLRGNHDDPAKAREHPNYIGEFGWHEDEDQSLFHVCGAYSIDKSMRVPFKSWWPEEELTPAQVDECVKLYEDDPRTPDILLSHDCPGSVAQEVLYSTHIGLSNAWRLDKLIPNRTRLLLDVLWTVKAPKLWAFGHYHLPFDKVINGTRFVCVPEKAAFNPKFNLSSPVQKGYLNGAASASQPEPA